MSKVGFGRHGRRSSHGSPVSHFFPHPVASRPDLRAIRDAISLKTAVGSIWFPWLLYIIGSSAAFLDVFRGLRTAFLFVWACFLRPFIKPGKKSSEQRDQLDAFYQTQATVYDTTRSHLLEGREHMLQLLASHLKAQNKHMFGASKLRIWVDVGGGTGWNIEKM